jgi:hypothetical protein
MLKNILLLISLTFSVSCSLDGDDPLLDENKCYTNDEGGYYEVPCPNDDE